MVPALHAAFALVGVAGNGEPTIFHWVPSQCTRNGLFPTGRMPTGTQLPESTMARTPGALFALSYGAATGARRNVLDLENPPLTAEPLEGRFPYVVLPYIPPS
jgi:hypothetical protein